MTGSNCNGRCPALFTIFYSLGVGALADEVRFPSNQSSIGLAAPSLRQAVVSRLRASV